MNKEYIFRIILSAEHPYLKQHIVNGYSVLPGVAVLKIAYNYSRKIIPFVKFNCMEDVFWLSPVVSYGNNVEKLLFLSASNLNNEILVKYSFRDYYGKAYASGIIRGDTKSHISKSFFDSSLINSMLNDTSLKVITHGEVYEEFNRIGIKYGLFFQSLSKVKVKDNYGVAEIACKQNSLEFVNLLDGSFQSGMAISKGSNIPNLMPISLGKLVFYKDLNINKCGTYTVFTEKVNKFRTNIAVLDENMENCISVFDLGVRAWSDPGH